MTHPRTATDDPVAYLVRHRPDRPVFFFSPTALARSAARFRAGFPGQVTYAVKANPAPEVLSGLSAAGLEAFDVASPEEMRAVRRVAPAARLHYHNPVRSPDEIAAARRFGIASWSVDRASELEKLAGLPRGSE
ncbi:type III PLP-dependent enzyme, partial [Roseivivax sp. CAU 1761]